MKSSNQELESLYEYLQTKKIIHPIKGVIPFKLFPFQKRILEAIHTNNRIIIIKARQIGVTTLLAGYYAWRFHKDGSAAVINSHADVSAKILYKIAQRFEPKIHKLYTNGKGLNSALNIYDEWNYNENCGKPYDHVRFLQPGKHIIAGTVDKKNKLHDLISELVARKDSYHTVWFPIKWCDGMWTKRRISNAKKGMDEQQWKMEMECQWP